MNWTWIYYAQFMMICHMKDSPKEVIGMEMALWFFILSFGLWLGHLRAIQAMTTGSSLVTWRLSQLHVHSKEDIEVKTVQPFSMYFGAVLNLYHVDAFHVKTGSDKLTLGSLKRWCRNRFWVELFLLECGGQNPPPLQCYQGGKRT